MNDNLVRKIDEIKLVKVEHTLECLDYHHLDPRERDCINCVNCNKERYCPLAQSCNCPKINRTIDVLSVPAEPDSVVGWSQKSTIDDEKLERQYRNHEQREKFRLLGVTEKELKDEMLRAVPKLINKR